MVMDSPSEEVGEPTPHKVDHMDDICNEMMQTCKNDGTGQCKPPTANLILDNTLQTTSMMQSLQSPVDNIHINIVNAAYS